MTAPKNEAVPVTAKTMTAPVPAARAAAPTITIIDVATSGSNAERDSILEVACILIDAGTLDVLETIALIVKHPAGSVTAPDFHAALLEECAHPDRTSLASIEGMLLAGPWTTSRVVCNRALIEFDLKFLTKHMPTLARALTKGAVLLELKALAVLHEARGGAAYASAYPRTYRAGDDAIAAYEELVHLVAPAAATAGVAA